MFTRCSIVGSNIETAVYMRHGPGVIRGDPRFVMSRTELKRFIECPAKWLAGGSDDDSTDETKFGNWVDTYLLGDAGKFSVTPSDYECVGMVCPSCGSVTESQSCKKCGVKRAPQIFKEPWNSNATVCEKWEAEEVAKGKIVLKPEKMQRVERASKNLIDDPETGPLIRHSTKQVMIVGEYHDPETDIIIPVKILIDLVPLKTDPRWGKCLADLKTARSALPRLWPTEVFDRWYDAQAAMALLMYRNATGEDRLGFIHAIVENKPPFQVGYEWLSESFHIGQGGEDGEPSPDTYGVGARKLEFALAWLANCLKTGKWPNHAGMLPERDKLLGWPLCQPKDWMILSLADYARPDSRSPSKETLEYMECELMAHRFLYYVMGTPVITDPAYDALEKDARNHLPRTSQVHGIGSDNAADYDGRFVDFARGLLENRNDIIP